MFRPIVLFIVTGLLHHNLACSSIGIAHDIDTLLQTFLTNTRDRVVLYSLGAALTVLISNAEKQGEYADYVKYIKEYIATPGLDASDMTLANWAKPFSIPGADETAKTQMIEVLRNRVAEIESGKRQGQNKVGNMKLSRPTDELLRMIIQTMETGKLPGQ